MAQLECENAVARCVFPPDVVKMELLLLLYAAYTMTAAPHRTNQCHLKHKLFHKDWSWFLCLLYFFNHFSVFFNFVSIQAREGAPV